MHPIPGTVTERPPSTAARLDRLERAVRALAENTHSPALASQAALSELDSNNETQREEV